MAGGILAVGERVLASSCASAEGRHPAPTGVVVGHENRSGLETDLVLGVSDLESGVSLLPRARTVTAETDVSDKTDLHAG